MNENLDPLPYLRPFFNVFSLGPTSIASDCVFGIKILLGFLVSPRNRRIIANVRHWSLFFFRSLASVIRWPEVEGRTRLGLQLPCLSSLCVLARAQRSDATPF